MDGIAGFCWLLTFPHSDLIPISAAQQLMAGMFIICGSSPRTLRRSFLANGPMAVDLQYTDPVPRRLTKQGVERKGTKNWWKWVSMKTWRSSDDNEPIDNERSYNHDDYTDHAGDDGHHHRHCHRHRRRYHHHLIIISSSSSSIIKYNQLSSFIIIYHHRNPYTHCNNNHNN